MNIEYCKMKALEIPFVKGQSRVFSCVVNKRGRIISQASNLYNRTHPTQREYSVNAGLSESRCYLHSEVRSILAAAKFNQKNCKLIVCRIGNGGKILDSKPCISC